MIRSLSASKKMKFCYPFILLQLLIMALIYDNDYSSIINIHWYENILYSYSNI
jgi:hypothetical protein